MMESRHDHANMNKGGGLTIGHLYIHIIHRLIHISHINVHCMTMYCTYIYIYIPFIKCVYTYIHEYVCISCMYVLDMHKNIFYELRRSILNFLLRCRELP